MIRALSLLLGTVLAASAAMEPASQPLILNPTEGAKAGRALVADILSRRPSENLTNTGTLKIRDAKGRRTEIPVRFQTIATDGNRWEAQYEATSGSNRVWLAVVHDVGQANQYLLQDGFQVRDVPRLSGNQTMTPFAGSDFWLADLGLEFLHWPGQRVLRKEIRRGQSCSVLESANPHPAPGAYSRVVSWVDIDTGGIINAEAYDAEGKPLKEFAAKSFKKVHGQWELQEIQMENRQTGSRTAIVFDLGRK